MQPQKTEPRSEKQWTIVAGTAVAVRQRCGRRNTSRATRWQLQQRHSFWLKSRIEGPNAPYAATEAAAELAVGYTASVEKPAPLPPFYSRATTSAFVAASFLFCGAAAAIKLHSDAVLLQALTWPASSSLNPSPALVFEIRALGACQAPTAAVNDGPGDAASSQNAGC